MIKIYARGLFAVAEISNRREQAVAAFVERFAAFLTEAGFPRMPARVFVRLLATDSGRLTAAQLTDALRVSAAAISGAMRYLMQINLVSREREPGSRRDYYCVHANIWYEAIARRDQVLTRGERSAREGIELLGRSTPAGARMAETLEFFEFMQEELPSMLRKWQAHKAQTRTDAPRKRPSTRAARSRS